MAPRAILNRLAIAESFSTRSQQGGVVDFVRPPVEAIDDLDWYANESHSEMGQSSPLGPLLERASRERELVVVDDRYMHGKLPGVYGKSFSDGPWQEWVEDESVRRSKGSFPHVKNGGYFREVWAERYAQTPAPSVEESGTKRVVATEMRRNVGELLALLPARARLVLLTRHEDCVESVAMRAVFGNGLARIAHLSKAAREKFAESRLVARAQRALRETEFEELEASPRPFEKDDAEQYARLEEELSRPVERNVSAWLEGIAARIEAKRPRAGETKLAAAVKKEMKAELGEAYRLFEKARDRLPSARYPHQSQLRRARRLSIVGGT